jgi:hypothetical protein
MQTLNMRVGEAKEKEKAEALPNPSNKSSIKTKPSISDLDAIKIVD